MGEYTQQIEEAKRKESNPILKTHYGARYCDTDKDCPKYKKVKITNHYQCPYCLWGMKTIEGYDPCKNID
jgi:ribosomal protein L37AE/L43A